MSSPTFTYSGRRLRNPHGGEDAVVTVHQGNNAHALGTYNKALGWASNGHEWGYGGTGPHCLARAILVHHFTKAQGLTVSMAASIAGDLQGRFVRQVVSQLDREAFDLTTADVHAWIHATPQHSPDDFVRCERGICDHAAIA